jgi:hypothetical protein
MLQYAPSGVGMVKGLVIIEMAMFWGDWIEAVNYVDSALAGVPSVAAIHPHTTLYARKQSRLEDGRPQRRIYGTWLCNYSN